MPGEIWVFVDFRNISGGTTFKFKDQNINAGVYAVIESSQYDGEFDITDPTKSRILRPLNKEVEEVGLGGVPTKRRFYLANVEAFAAPICVVPDIRCQPTHSKIRYFHVQSRSQWPKNFIAWVNRPYETDYLDDDMEEDLSESSDDDDHGDE